MLLKRIICGCMKIFHTKIELMNDSDKKISLLAEYDQREPVNEHHQIHGA